MLVISRKTNESIVINHDITVVVLGIQGNKVRLGFEAPAEVAIQRREFNTECTVPLKKSLNQRA